MSGRTTSFTLEFVDSIPVADAMAPGILYVSMKYATVSHKCACGCGLEVVTPLSRTDWSLQYDGESVSLHPSIGSWGFPCQSHYWIKHNAVRWAPKWTRAQIDAERQLDRVRKRAAFGEDEEATPVSSAESSPRHGLWNLLYRLFRG
jgi:hypothetical protein